MPHLSTVPILKMVAERCVLGPPPLRFNLEKQRRIKVNIFSETGLFALEHQGGHTAFLDCCDVMANHPGLEVVVNAREACDVLHSHSWGPLFFAWGARRWAGRRVFTAHVVPETAIGSFPCAKIAQPFTRSYVRAVCNFSDAVVAVAPRAAEVLRNLGVASPVSMVPNPIRADRFNATPILRAAGRRLLRLTDNRAVVLGVGQLQPRKGVADFASVAASCPEAHFIWVGGRPFGVVSADYFGMNRLVRSPPANLTFAGTVAFEQMPAIYNAADVMLFPSFQENCPYAPMEAASCGCPVVFRDLQEYRALYRTEYLRALDVPMMVAAVRRLLASSSERRHWTGASRALSRGFQVNDFVQSIALLYDTLACAVLDERRGV